MKNARKQVDKIVKELMRCKKMVVDLQDSYKELGLSVVDIITTNNKIDEAIKNLKRI